MGFLIINLEFSFAYKNFLIEFIIFFWFAKFACIDFLAF